MLIVVEMAATEMAATDSVARLYMFIYCLCSLTYCGIGLVTSCPWLHTHSKVIQLLHVRLATWSKIEVLSCIHFGC